jgi:hypothetical protein
VCVCVCVLRSLQREREREREREGEGERERKRERERRVSNGIFTNGILTPSPLSRDLQGRSTPDSEFRVQSGVFPYRRIMSHKSSLRVRDADGGGAGEARGGGVRVKGRGEARGGDGAADGGAEDARRDLTLDEGAGREAARSEREKERRGRMSECEIVYWNSAPELGNRNPEATPATLIPLVKPPGLDQRPEPYCQ